MPDTDVRADFEALLLSSANTGSEIDTAPYERAVKKFPNSARLHFRLGTLGDESRRSQALKRASELDPENALPLYLLASRTISTGSPDQAVELLSQANRRDRVDYYRAHDEALERDPMLGLQIAAASAGAQFPVYTSLRQLARGANGHAAKLHAAGQTDGELALLAEVKKMAWKSMRAEDATLIDVLVGVAMVGIAQKQEKQIYADTRSEAGLAQVTREKKKLTYLNAGSRAYFGEANREFARRFAVVAAPSLSAASIIPQSWLTAAVLLLWVGFALATRGKPASEIYRESACQAFSAGRLLKLYALIFLPLSIAIAPLAYMASTGGMTGFKITAIEAAVVLPSVLLLWLSIRSYRRSYRRAAESAGQESPRFWRGALARDKREVLRRLAAVYGGAMVFLALWALLVFGGAKLTVGAFPWQTGKVMAGMHEVERQYVADLLAGKVKVPEKYIREAEQRDMRKEKPASHGEK